MDRCDTYILSFVEKGFKVVVLIASWISQRDKSNKQPQQASISSWLQPGLPLYNIYMRLCMIVSLMQFYQTLTGQSSTEVKRAR